MLLPLGTPILATKAVCLRASAMSVLISVSTIGVLGVHIDLNERIQALEDKLGNKIDSKFEATTTSNQTWLFAMCLIQLLGVAFWVSVNRRPAVKRFAV